MTRSNIADYAVVYGEFEYQAGTWDYARRVVCKIEKPANQMTHMHMFVVTNMGNQGTVPIRGRFCDCLSG